MLDYSQIRAVLYDVGQTLLYPDLRFLQNLLAEYGVQIDLPSLARGAALGREKISRAKGNERNYQAFFGYWVKLAGAAEKDVPEILRKIYARHQREHLWSWLDPEAKDTLHTLHARGYRLAIISNADGQVPEAMAKLGIDQYFDHIVDSALVGVEKPDSRIFAMAVEKLHLPAAACLYVGDHYDNDVLGARNAGLVPLLLDPFDVVPENDVDRIHRLSDLLEMLPLRSTLR